MNAVKLATSLQEPNTISIPIESKPLPPVKYIENPPIKKKILAHPAQKYQQLQENKDDFLEDYFLNEPEYMAQDRARLRTLQQSRSDPIVVQFTDKLGPKTVERIAIDEIQRDNIKDALKAKYRSENNIEDLNDITRKNLAREYAITDQAIKESRAYSQPALKKAKKEAIKIVNIIKHDQPRISNNLGTFDLDVVNKLCKRKK